MPNLTIPISPQRQYSMMDIALAHAFGGGPRLDQVQEIFPGAGRYIQPNVWPAARASGPSGGGGFSGLAAKAPEPEAPRSSPQARALWPSLP
jgi:hypothetical protein